MHAIEDPDGENNRARNRCEFVDGTKSFHCDFLRAAQPRTLTLPHSVGLIQTRAAS